MHPSVKASLDAAGVPYTVHRHADLGDIRSPQDFAAALGYELPRITKSLFLRSATGGHQALVVCSGPSRVDFKGLGAELGWNRVEVASRDQLAEVLGYPPNGVSPLGIPSTIPVSMDQALMAFPTILVGGGETGVEVEIEPELLARMTNAVVRAVAESR